MHPSTCIIDKHGQWSRFLCDNLTTTHVHHHTTTNSKNTIIQFNKCQIWSNQQELNPTLLGYCNVFLDAWLFIESNNKKQIDISVMFNQANKAPSKALPCFLI